MSFLDLVKTRYSVRKFSDRPVEPEKLDAVLEAGRLAPTAKNLQPCKIYVVRSEEALAKLRSLTPCHYNAPLVLICTYDTTQQWQNPLEKGITSGVEDISIIATHLMLAATEQGLGSCWVNLFSPSKLKETFQLPEAEVPVLLLPLGYAAEDAAAAPWHTQKKALAEIVSYL